MEKPFGRMVRFIPELDTIFHHLVGLDLFRELPSSERAPAKPAFRMTLKGRVAHILPCQINPKQANWRTPEKLSDAVCFWALDGTHRGVAYGDDTGADKTLSWVREALNQLESDGLAERDPRHRKDAWRLRVD